MGNSDFNAAKPEPPPTANTSRPIYEMVIDDIKARAKFGKTKYGTYLQARNGRRSLDDLYQEILDSAAYVRQKIKEESHHKAFWFNPDDERLEFFDTIGDARTAAQKFLDDALTGDGWSIDEDAIDEIVVGFVTTKAVLHRHMPTFQEVEDGVVEDKSIEVWEVKLEATE